MFSPSYCRHIVVLAACACFSLAATHAQTTPEPAPAVTEPVASSAPAHNPGSNLIQKLAGGGTTVLVQLALSVVAGAVFIERSMNSRRNRIAPHQLAVQMDQFWQQGEFARIIESCKKQPSALARIIAFVVEHRRNALADISRAAGDMGAREIRRDLQKAYPLMVIGMLAPLLGLLGTVIGMIETFASVSDTGSLGNAGLLAGGISKFLVCTGMGLFIAVPCLTAYHFFKSRTIGLGHILEEEVDFILNRWFLIREDDHAN